MEVAGNFSIYDQHIDFRGPLYTHSSLRPTQLSKKLNLVLPNKTDRDFNFRYFLNERETEGESEREIKFTIYLEQTFFAWHKVEIMAYFHFHPDF